MNMSNVKNGIASFFVESIPEFKNKIKSFFSNAFSVTSCKATKITGAAVAAVLMMVVLIFNAQFVNLSNNTKWLFLGFALVAPIIIGLCIAYTVRLRSERANKIWSFAFFALMPMVTMTMTEILNNVFIYDMTYLGFFGNYIVILLFQFLVFALCGSFRVTYLAVNTLWFGLALAHCYIMQCRGTPFIPWDFWGISTAANVANTYSFLPSHLAIMGSLIYIFIIVVAIKTKTPKYSMVGRIFSRSFMMSFFSFVMSIFYFTTIFADAGVTPDFWSQTRGYKNYGFVFSFFCNTRYLYMTEPEDYDHENIRNEVDAVKGTDNITTVEPTGHEPNIICIMNESFSDLSVLGDFETNIEYMPFIKSLTENTVKGNLYVPVIGAGTSNSEFEFLTGNSTAFLPSGSNAYMLYVTEALPSLVSTLEHQGYSSWAFHPYYRSGWNRSAVYENFGFDLFTSLENLIDSSLLNEMYKYGDSPDYLQSVIDEKYPDRSNMLIRQYVSDSYNYDILIKNFEERDKSKPYFAFNVTMQNHGGYTLSSSNFDECVQINSPNYYTKATKYLSLVKASDDAFRELIEYFENVDEPTVICMFGDHQPNVESEFASSLLGVSSLDDVNLKQEQDRHVTPFIIWANYDIDEQYIERLSVNYLSSYVLDIAGVQLTDYNEYLIKLSETVPVVNTVGYIDANGNYYKWSDNSEYTELLKAYEHIQYNNLFDSANRKNDVFYLNADAETQQ